MLLVLISILPFALFFLVSSLAQSIFSAMIVKNIQRIMFSSKPTLIEPIIDVMPQHTNVDTNDVDTSKTGFQTLKLNQKLYI